MTGMDEADLQQELERAIGRGPALPLPAERLAAGRRALRRRRVAAAALAAGAVLAVVVPVAVLAGGAATSGVEPTPLATQSASPEVRAETTGPAADPSPSRPPQPWRGEYVRYTPDGELEIRPGVEVLDRVDDYLAGTRWVRSIALEIRFRGEVGWVDAAQLRDGRATSGWSEPSDGWADFRAWVEDQAAANGVGGPMAGGSGFPGLVEARGDGTFGELPGTTILAQRADPELPAGFAPASETTGAAYVEREGTHYLVLSRPGDLVVVPAAGHGDSLDELLAWARERYASGEGLL